MHSPGHILLEFQSTIDRRMARRMLDYTLRILDGLGDHELGPGGTYPPVIPVVQTAGQRRGLDHPGFAEADRPAGESSEVAGQTEGGSENVDFGRAREEVG